MHGFPRGILLNNPFNIRISNNPWIGKMVPSRDKDFEQFAIMENGIHAGLKILVNYCKLDGLQTIQGIIKRWAPASENPTGNYIGFVCHACACNPDDIVNIGDPAFLGKLASAIIEFEQGSSQFVTQGQIASEISRLGLPATNGDLVGVA